MITSPQKHIKTPPSGDGGLKKRFAIFGNVHQAKKSVSIQKLLACLQKHNAEIVMEEDFHKFLTDGQKLDITVDRTFTGNDFDADFAFSLGGDGTLLRVAEMVGANQTPIVGVNFGRLGFLADVSPAEMESVIDDLYKGKYAVEEHAVIKVSTPSPLASPYALNDIAVLKRDTASMISIRCYIDGEYLMTYQADGLIISTPTGSTAYSLSNGGPIIAPTTNVLCLTPVAPHSLNTRPIVVNDTSVIELSIESRSHNYLVAIDGRSESLNDEVRLTIKKAAYKTMIVKRHSRKYFNVLRDKMLWGLDQRG